MDAPLIAIPSYGRNAQGHVSLPADYVTALRRAGGIPVLIPPGETRLEQWLDLVDGLLLAGGNDLDPARYEGQPHDTVTDVDPERDAAEFELLESALDVGLPILAICRGMQLLNVFLGGDLFADIPSQVEGAGPHRQGEPAEPRPIEHEVVIDPGSRLGALLGEHRIIVPSLHHQAIDEVAAELSAVAHAPDGLVEAVELADHPFCIGVQWHPELAAAEVPVHQRPFDGLVAAARGEL